MQHLQAGRHPLAVSMPANSKQYFCESDGTREANANLIAAAPELYEALMALLPEGWGDDDTMDHMRGVKLARLAIAKAEGREP